MLYRDGWQVSIHAPVRGSDRPGKPWGSARPLFQSTLPCEGATPPSRWDARVIKFQSTLPCEGATKPARKSNRFTGVSIHAPVRGSDELAARMRFIEGVSIHAPVRGSDGADVRDSGARRFNPRSRARERPWCPPFVCPIICFNPRSRARERLACCHGLALAFRFQSTLPCEGATPTIRILSQMISVSIHAPVRGSDAGTRSIGKGDRWFQSTLPCEGATDFANIVEGHIEFQSTLPCEGATG